MKHSANNKFVSISSIIGDRENYKIALYNKIVLQKIKTHFDDCRI